MKMKTVRKLNKITPQGETEEITIEELTNSQGESIYLIFYFNDDMNCSLPYEADTFFSTPDEAIEHLKEETDDHFEEIDVDDVGYGTMVINNYNKAIFYRYRTGYTWYIKHSSGSIRHPQDPKEVNYETLREAKEVAKRTYV
ncbi:hypothetical protein FINN_63 [Bacillus phage Finn]|uniref:Uncharacterized protein n=1 Tax=Bacillus phage Finn TaxID=2884419 RepID=M1IF10_9CAUD|nr:hypothetical protein FINN_63 [Bacillus phage Finn]AGE61056.1 hypothetical protein FINN_63 [Bacillus phage Finn]